MEHDKLEQLLIEKEIPYTRDGITFTVSGIFQDVLEKLAEYVGLYKV
jgi:hypothetical protein